MILRRIERREVVPRILDLRALGKPVAQALEQGNQLVTYLGQDMRMAHRATNGRHRDIQRLSLDTCCRLGRTKHAPSLRMGGLKRHLEPIDSAPVWLARFGGQGRNQLKGLRDPPALAAEKLGQPTL